MVINAQGLVINCIVPKASPTNLNKANRIIYLHHGNEYIITLCTHIVDAIDIADSSTPEREYHRHISRSIGHQNFSMCGRSGIWIICLEPIFVPSEFSNSTHYRAFCHPLIFNTM